MQQKKLMETVFNKALEVMPEKAELFKKAFNEMLDVYDYETDKKQIKPLSKSGAMFTANRFDPRHNKWFNNVELILTKSEGDSLPEGIKPNDTVSLMLFINPLKQLMVEGAYIPSKISVADFKYEVGKVKFTEEYSYNTKNNNFELEVVKEDRTNPAVEITKTNKAINVDWNELPFNNDLGR